jgi:deoxyribodipyrimidine photo-lyase
MNKLSLFIFRRDLRLVDNTALIEALNNSKKIIICFIFDERQIDKNEYFSINGFNFLLDSLSEIEKEFKKNNSKLYLFYGKNEEIIIKIILEKKINAIYLNRDYTPFSIKRDKTIKEICIKKNITLKIFSDLLLTEPEQIKKENNTPYSIFTPFYKKASIYSIKKPTFENINFNKVYSENISFEKKDIIKKLKDKYKISDNIKINSGIKNGQLLLKNLKKLNNYNIEKDIPYLNKTSHLSSHLKFGTISIREAYYSIQKNIGENHPLIRQLYWRDFFTHIAYNNPHVFKGAFYKKYDKLIWENDENKFLAWREGKTGFPIVDAGMRELNNTGYMHNRLRMITSSFLVKDLHIDWRLGEKYFASKLIDYDPSLNNGNWQWAASTGCDAQPYFRIFNPLLQQKKFDSNCEYVKKWIPELKNLTPKEIQNLYNNYNSDKDEKNKNKVKNNNITINYPNSIIDHKNESEKAKYYYKILN